MNRTHALDHAWIALASAALLLGTTGCLAGSDPESEASDDATATEALRRGACEEVRLDIRVGPASSSSEAEKKCVYQLEEDCESLGCAADLDTIEVEVYGEKRDRFVCQGVEEEVSRETTRHLASCSTPATTPAPKSPEEPDKSTSLCGNAYPSCPARSHCELRDRAIGICVADLATPSTRP